MSIKERLLHAALFELFALLLFTLAAILLTEKSIFSMSGLAITLSLIAMGWNYIYNLVFDQLFTEDRLSRGLLLRITHGLGFEIGMLLLSFPVIMWVMELPFLAVLAIDVAAMLFFLLYAIVFNWVYDIARERVSLNTMA